MYNGESIIYDINMITKLVCYLLFAILMLITNNIFVLILVSAITIIETTDNKYFFYLNIISGIMILIGCFFSSILFIPKIILFLTYTYLLTKVTNLGQLRYLIEITFYKYKNNKLTKLFLMIMYYFKYIKIYILKYVNLRKSYGFSPSLWYTKFSLENANKLTIIKIKELVKINEIRFYNYHSKKTYLEKIKFESWDYIYLSIHTLLVIISILARR